MTHAEHVKAAARPGLTKTRTTWTYAGWCQECRTRAVAPDQTRCHACEQEDTCPA